MFSETVYLPDLRFKGSRNYLHGTDIIPALEKRIAPELGGFLREIRFHLPIRGVPILAFEPPSESTNGQPCVEAVWSLEGGEKTIKAWLYDSGTQISERTEYREDLATEGFMVTDSSGSGAGYTSFSILENVVAMTKRLNLSLYDPSPRQYLFARARFHGSLPATWSEIEVKCYPVGSQRATNNHVFVDSSRCADLLFMVGSF